MIILRVPGMLRHRDVAKLKSTVDGLLKSVSVMTDTDNTGTKVEAWYGDLQFSEK